MSPVRRPNLRLIVAATVATILLAAGSTVALAAAGGAFRDTAPAGTRARCTAPTLEGAVVNVTLTDMDGMMGGGWRGMGMARVVASPGVVRAGTVSLRVVNQGMRTHELVVLPLPAGQPVGTRAVGADGQVDERSSLGEASRSCGTGEGDGVTAGATGWVTLTLKPGRYELVCNLPSHYAAGMYAELDVT